MDNDPRTLAIEHEKVRGSLNETLQAIIGMYAGAIGPSRVHLTLIVVTRDGAQHFVSTMRKEHGALALRALLQTWRQGAAEDPRIDRETIREVFMANGFVPPAGSDDLDPQVYDAAFALMKEALLRGKPIAFMRRWAAEGRRPRRGEAGEKLPAMTTLQIDGDVPLHAGVAPGILAASIDSKCAECGLAHQFPGGVNALYCTNCIDTKILPAYCLDGDEERGMLLERVVAAGRAAVGDAQEDRSVDAQLFADLAAYLVKVKPDQPATDEQPAAANG